MTPEHPPEDDSFEQDPRFNEDVPFRRQYHEFVDKVGSTLDLEAGLAEVLKRAGVEKPEPDDDRHTD